MKRRTFLGISLSTFGTPLLATGTSLYGTPGSITQGVRVLNEGDVHLLSLPLSEIGIPDTALSELGAYAGIWQNILSDHGQRQLFKSDPDAYLEASGIPPSVLTSGDQEIKMLVASANDETLRLVVAGDYNGFFSHLQTLGLVGGAPSTLKTRISELIRPKAAELKDKIAAMQRSGNLPKIDDLLESNELEFLYSQLIPDLTQVATAAIPVAAAAVIVLTVVAYVSVGVAVTVGALAGVYVSVAVSMAVTASGGGSGHGMLEKEPDLQFAGPVTGPLPKFGQTSKRERAARGELAQRALIGKRMLMLDPQSVENARTTARVATLLGNKTYAVEAGRKLIRDELDAIIEVLEELDVITIPAATRDQVLNSMHSLALKGAGLAPP